MRLAGGRLAFVAIAVAVVLAGCDPSSVHDGTAAAATSRAQVVPAARDLYRSLFEASAKSVDVFDWGYQPCGDGSGQLSYNIGLRLFAFATTQNTDFPAFRRQVVDLLRGNGWTLQRRPPTRSETLPTVPSAYYRLTKRGLFGAMGLVGDVNPLVGVTGTISVNGPCFDAGDAAGSLQSHSASAPFPVR